MNILVSNDDGYLSEGIVVLAEHLAALGTVTVVAPDRNRSGASNSLTLMRPVEVTRISQNVFAAHGTPADCVQVAFGGLMQEKPDIVVSGINDGPNLADDTLYSGTVAAAMEGRFLAYMPIAVSMASSKPKHFSTAASVVVTLIRSLSPLPANSQPQLLNVNVPDLPVNELKGIKATRLGTRHAAKGAGPHDNPRGANMYWLGAAGQIDDCSEGTDFAAVDAGYVSVTPLHTDLTNHQQIKKTQDLCSATWAEKTA